MKLFANDQNIILITRLVFLFYLFKQTMSSSLQKSFKDISSENSNEILCEEEYVSSGSEIYIWKRLYNNTYASPYAASKPLCFEEKIDGKIELVIRKCNKDLGKWYPEQINCLPNHLNPLTTSRRNHFCPESFIEVIVKKKYLCLLVSDEPQEFDERFCYGSDILLDPINKFISIEEATLVFQYLSTQNINRFWLPIRRDDHNKYLNPFVIKLPGEYWRDIYEIPLPFHDILSDKHCVSGSFDINATSNKSNIVSSSPNNNYNNNNYRNLLSRENFQMKITDCSENLHSVCVFSETLIAYSGCSQNFLALSSKPNECYGIEMEAGLFEDILHPLDFDAYIRSYNTITLILEDLEIPNDVYFRMNEFQDPENHRKYAVEMNTKGNIRIVPHSVNYNSLSKEYLTNRKTVEMFLKHDTQDNSLTLTVYNRHYIFRLDDGDEHGIKCFSNAGYEIMKKAKHKMFWQNSLETKTLYDIKLIANEPGHYWCEAHTIFNFSLIRTNRVVAAKETGGHTFAAIVEMHSNRNSSEWQSLYTLRRSLKAISKQVKQSLCDINDESYEFHKEFDDFKLRKVRLMDIIKITESNTENQFRFEALYHITVSSQSVPDGSSEELFDSNEINKRIDLSHLKDALEDLLTLWQTRNNIKWNHTLRHTEFCLAEIISSETSNEWPKTRYGQRVTTTQLCLQSNGLPISRQCQGEFLWGAYWSDYDDDDGYLDNSQGQKSCIKDFKDNLITEDLQDLVLKKITKKEPEKAIKELKSLLEDKLDALIPADFYYMAEIMQDTTKKLLKPKSQNNSDDALTTHSDMTKNIVKIYNYLMKVNEKIIRPSIVLNSTNILLETLENIIYKMATEDKQNYENLNNPPQHNSNNNNSTTIAFDSIRANHMNNNNNNNNNEKIIEFKDRYIPEGGQTSKVRRSAHKIKLKESDKHIEDVNYEDVGVFTRTLTNFLTFIINPYVANITGIALFSSSDSSDLGSLQGSFENHYFRFLLSNQSVDDLLYESGLKLAAYIPESLLSRLDEISKPNSTKTPNPRKSNVRIVVNIYSNDVLFQEKSMQNSKNKSTTGYVISISIPGHNRDLPEMVPIIFKVDNPYEANGSEISTLNSSSHNDASDEGRCGYWNYEHWASDGIVYLGRSDLDRNIILCGCTHLTPFAYLVNGRYNFSVDSSDPYVIQIKKVHTKALDIITVLGCSLSLLGILGIFITAVIFQNWRQKASSKVLLHLSAAIALQMVIFCFFNTDEYTTHLIENKIFTDCIVIGALLQYSILVQFSWMLLIAYLQFKRYVQVFANSRPRRFIMKSSFLGWGVPCIPVICVVLFDRKSYIPVVDDIDEDTICYPSGYSFYFGILLPITIVIVANLFIFIIIIYSLLKGSQVPLRRTEKSLAMSQIRLSVLLFFLLGFTWIFGLLTVIRAGIVFSYLFCLTATLQGFIVFIYFVILDPVTRRMWGGLFGNLCGVKENLDSSCSMKESTQTF